ncbi:hypothetical protein QN372_00320 [Undibacterium sp. RTI2.1]|uniref:hypothetical protein n=1 Tax=unclassified Undibacterium TaxID=2630295 RepID=UPI002B23DDFD|nr:MULTISPECIES: hypothetical protein [unclassified Undibacterium]MEB0029183.1 hypothetical protein [Undibacterium sp. RTI2.1]
MRMLICALHAYVEGLPGKVLYSLKITTDPAILPRSTHQSNINQQLARRHL